MGRGELDTGMVLSMEKIGKSMVCILLLSFEDLSTGGWEFVGLGDSIWLDTNQYCLTHPAANFLSCIIPSDGE